MNTRWLLLLIPVLCVGVTAALADDWPQWRGPDRTDISKEQGLLQTWPEQGPKLLWKYDDAGIGFSCFAIVGDVLYTMGARKEEEYAIALDIKDGKPKQLWESKIGPIFVDNVTQCGDGPRATPTVDGDNIYCLGGTGELVCFSRDKGKEIWRKNLKKDFGGKVMEHIPPGNWGYCESPIVDGDKLICCPGGEDGWMVALDKKNGAVKWRTKDIKDQATDSSIIIAEFGGVKQYINSSYKGKDGAGIFGISAADGKVLWSVTLKWDCYAICSTPLVHKDKTLGDLVYVSAGYSKGCQLLQITKSPDGAFTAKTLYDDKTQRNMFNEHGGMVLLDGFVYGYSDPAGWVCQDLVSGEIKWKDIRALEGKGSLTYADGNLYLLSDEGEVALARATPTSKNLPLKGKFSLPALSKINETRPTNAGAKVWTHPVIANGRLYIRDQELIYCYAVK